MLSNVSSMVSVAINETRAFYAGGATFIRWGRSSCPSGATLIYEGLMGGGWYEVSGSSSEYICLPYNPVYTTGTEGHTLSPLYSTEYESHQNVFPNDVHDYDAPCVLCQVQRRSMLMIPATVTCPNTWTIEYSGYLMSTRDQQRYASREYVCIDGNPDTILGSQGNTNGALLYFVTADCTKSFIPCTPYKHQWPIVCVVCTI